MEEKRQPLVIKVVPVEATGGWKPVSIPVSTYDSIKLISEEAHVSMGKATTMLLEYALENVVIEK